MPTIDLGYVVGPQGPQGATGATGAAGPNQITGSTSTTLSGILQGNGSAVSALQSDSAPTENSSNAIRSGAVYSALNRKCNRNLLDNWYFVGGGSQLGAVLPINQRGQTSYAAVGYGIDRWSYDANNVTVHTLTLNSGYIRWQRTTAGGGNPKFAQPVKLQANATYTLSILYRSNFSALGLTPSNRVISTSNSWAFASTTFTASADGMVGVGIQDFSVYNNVDDTGCYIDILAMKLEDGAQQTLAHEENGSWILNEIPDFCGELAKCQHYLKRISAWADCFPARTDADTLNFTVPGIMAQTPSSSASQHVYCYFGATRSDITGTITWLRTSIGVRGQMPRSTIAANTGGTLAFAADVLISAE